MPVRSLNFLSENILASVLLLATAASNFLASTISVNTLRLFTLISKNRMSV